MLNASPFVFLARAPAIYCKNCGSFTQLSIAVNLAATALGFILAAVVVLAYFKAAQPSGGGPMGVLPFLMVFPLGIGVLMVTQISFGSVCYLFYSFLRDRSHAR